MSLFILCIFKIEIDCRWGFVIHFGIDIYSRYLLYATVATVNNASTVLSAFQSGVEEKGLPVRIR